MKRYNTILINDIPANPEILRKQTAMHEAGHAAAIHLGNKQKQLPPVYFQIIINDLPRTVVERHSNFAHSHRPMACFARVEGGRLIHTLPSSLHDTLRRFDPSEREAYQSAFEADIVNFLAGPLAEAKYVALCDNEIFNPRLVNLDALHYYGGESDVALAKEYLNCIWCEPAEKERKIAELFMTAYQFVNHRKYWRAITSLADFILSSGKKMIGCDEIVRLLDAQTA